MQTQVLFEHPLNEKMRTWLRIEFLIQQLTVNLPIVDHAGALHFFRNVSELLDVFERGEVRTELLKELDRQQRKLQTWIGVPGVDQSRIEALIQQLKAAGLIEVSRGTGGVTITRPLDEITFLDIYKAVECAPDEQLFHFHENPNQQCPVGKNIHRVLDDRLLQVQKAMEDKLAQMTLADVKKDVTMCIEK